MSRDDKKRYYWLKLKKDFFKRSDIKLIESMKNGKDYVLFYIKLLCESVDTEGRLRFNDSIPYNEEMLSVITDTNIDTVKSAMELFIQLGMIEVIDNDTYFMKEVEKLTGSESHQTKRKKEAKEERKRLAAQKGNALPENGEYADEDECW